MPPPFGHKHYNKNGEGGRPIVWTDEKIDNEVEELDIWMNNPENMFIEKFCNSRGYLAQRLREWSLKHDRLKSMIELFHERQKILLFEGTLKRKLAYNMAALILNNSHGIVAKTEHKVTGDPISECLEAISGKSKDLVNDNQQERH
jgi:hypothetical protein